MKVCVYSSTLLKTDYKRQIFKQFATGVTAAGDTSYEQYELKYKEADVGVIFGAVRDKPSKAHLHQLKAEVINKHKPNDSLIVFDNPTIGRKLTDINKSNPYLRIGLNSFMQDDGIFNNENCKPDRWEKIKSTLGLEVKPWRRSGSHILIILQKLYDASLRGVEKERPLKHLKWLENVVQEIKSNSDREIIIRPHPLSLNDPREMSWLMDSKIPVQPRCGKSIVDDLKNCWACVTFTSGSAIDAIIEGIPTVTYDSGSMAYPICDKDCKDIENISMPDRDQWLHNLAYTQWHMNEMDSGAPWLHLKERVNENPNLSVL